MIGYVAQRPMEADVEGLIGAAHGARSEKRENARNGLPRTRLAQVQRDHLPEDARTQPGQGYDDLMNTCEGVADEARNRTFASA